MNPAGQPVNMHAATGPLATLLLVAAVEALARTGVLEIPNPIALAVIPVVYAGYSGGRAAGIISAAIALLYGLYFYAVPGAVLQYTGEDKVRLVVMALVAPFVAWMAGTLRERAERALRAQLSAERANIVALSGAERRIRSSEAQLRALIDALPASIAFVDRDKRIRLHNKHTEDMMNLPAMLIDGQKIEDVVGKEIYESMVRENAERALAGQRVTYERVQMMEGRERVVEVNMVPRHAEDGTVDGYFAMLFDVTRHKQALARIARLGERLRRALDGSRLALWELDVRSGVVQLGREWADIVGGARELRETTLRELRARVHPDDRDSVDEAFASVIERRAEQYDIEHRVQALDGGWKWVQSLGKAVEFDAEGRPLRLSGTNRDITSRKLAELGLRESERQLRLVTDAVPAMIVYLDADLRYRFCNEVYCRMTGRSEAEVLGRSVAEVVGPELHELSRPWLERALAGEQVTYERKHEWPSGRTSDLSVTYVPHVSWDGAVLGLYALQIDLTERKRAERIKEKFISMASHELRTPLTSIIWTLDELLEQGAAGLPPADAAKLRLAQQNAERMLLLADEILEIEKIDQGELQMNAGTVGLPALVARAVALNDGLARKHGVQLAAAPSEAVEVRADAERLMQVLSNLISNAAKHSPRGARVDIAIATHGQRCRTSVSDRGPGVPEAFQGRLFGRFEQSSAGKKLGGSGLGLAICKEIIERSGGTIGYEPREGGGSVFWFELPAAQRG